MIPFYKLSGAGNDFIALVEPLTRMDRPPTAAEVRAWCRRGVSLGADGLFLLHRSGPGSARMTYFNADGGEAALCLNGTRCAARLAFELGWADGGGALTVETGAGAFAARKLDPAGETGIAIEVPPPAGAPEVREVEAGGRRVRGWWVEIGVPHFVVEWPADLGDLRTAPVATLGPALRRHPDLGEGGANVDFVRFMPPTGPEHPARPSRIDVRSYERGVEAETLACGTGVLAAVAAGLAEGRLALPVEALTRGGFTLTVEGTVDGEAGGGVPRRWSLAGDARIVARGDLSPEAAALPAPPPWR